MDLPFLVFMVISQLELKKESAQYAVRNKADPAGFEPAIPGLEGQCFIHAKPRALINKLYLGYLNYSLQPFFNIFAGQDLSY